MPSIKQDPELMLAAGKSSVRQQRNSLLTASDWTQVADAPVERQAWVAYRQELRDVTSQETFPFEVTWPVAPK